jgi:hypothetical protein
VIQIFAPMLNVMWFTGGSLRKDEVFSYSNGQNKYFDMAILLRMSVVIHKTSPVCEISLSIPAPTSVKCFDLPNFPRKIISRRSRAQSCASLALFVRRFMPTSILIIPLHPTRNFSNPITTPKSEPSPPGLLGFHTHLFQFPPDAWVISRI